MAGVRDKLVRLENLLPGGAVHFEENDILLVETPTGKRHSDSVYRETFGIKTLEEDDDVELGESASEKDDVLLPLPDGWPTIPQLFVRRSWDFSTATSPSVNKAVSHLDLLQTSIEEWFKENETEILSRASSRAFTKSRATSVASGHSVPQQGILRGSASGNRRQIRFATPSAGPTASAKSRLSSATYSSQASSGKLSIEGLGFKADERIEGNTGPQKELPVLDEIAFDVPYLGAEEVIDEVIALLAHLETDRRSARQNLQKERDRMAMLQGKIDQLAMQRMVEFPEAVQREHEACSMDINELNWHVSYRSRIESRIKNKVAIAGVLYSRLKEDIEFVRKHCPLVQEKLDLERDAMERIHQAQHDTNDELSVTVDRCAKVETKSEEVYTKADVERNHLTQEVDAVRGDLAKINEDLAGAKMQFNVYIHQCNDYRQQLDQNQQELMVLEVKNENAKVAEEMQHAKVRDLQGKIVEQEFEHRKFVDQNTRLQKVLDCQRRTNRQAEQERVIAIKTKEDQLRKLTINNDEMDMDIEDAITNIQKCDKQRIADEKNLLRLEKEHARTGEQLKITEDDLAKVKVINNAILEKFEKEEERCVTEDESLRGTCEQLRKQVKEEVHSRTVIMARINADSNDLVKTQVETKQKNDKVMKKVDEVNSQVKVVEAKVQRLQSAYDERSKLISKLGSEIEMIQRQILEAAENHQATKDQVMPKHQEVSKQVTDTAKRLDHMAWKTEIMNKNMDEMAASFKMMSRSMATTQKAIDALQDQYDDLNIEIASGQHLEEDMRTALKQITARLQESDMLHKKQQRERNNVYSQHEATLEEKLALNKELASRYRQLQHEFLQVKDKSLDRYESRVKVETAIKDLKQIQSLQRRMHTALQDYYKLRGAYNQRELCRMETESTENAVKVGSLKGEMDGALENISHFLRTQMDGSTARRIAMEKVLREEAQEEQSIQAEAPKKSKSRSSSASTPNPKSLTPSLTAPRIHLNRLPTSVIEVK